MAGGMGERFWPLSRAERPKHLWNITGGDCMLSRTFARVARFIPKSNIMIITNPAQIKGIKKYCPEIPQENIISEPVGRDTTAAVGLAALLVRLRAKGDESSFAVFPSDSAVNDAEGFSETVLKAFEVAEKGERLVTIGIKPTFPATGYGYIKRSSEEGGAYKVERFYEKPNEMRAVSYLESGDFYWNSGIFVWLTSSISNALKDNAPKTFGIFEKIRTGIEGGGDFDKILAEYYPQIEKISIDFSVMEKSQNIWVVPAGFDWDDVGSWAAIERHLKRDEKGNIVNGEFYSCDASGCVVFDTANRATAIVGLKDIVVIHSADATLICRKDCTEKVKELVRILPPKLK